MPPAAGPGAPRRYCSTRCKNKQDGRRKTLKRHAQNLEAAIPPLESSADIAWLAGIVDGEGTIMLSHGGNRTPHLRVQLTNGSDAILDKVRGILRDAQVSWTELREKRGTTNLTVGTAGALRLYPAIRPYLVRQVAQYDAAVDFMLPRYGVGAMRIFWTDEDRAGWEQMRQRFHPNAVRR